MIKRFYRKRNDHASDTATSPASLLSDTSIPPDADCPYAAVDGSSRTNAEGSECGYFIAAFEAATLRRSGQSGGAPEMSCDLHLGRELPTTAAKSVRGGGLLRALDVLDSGRWRS